MQRLRCEWGGVGVEGPGLSTFYGVADGSLAISVAAAALFNELRSLFPFGLTINVPNGGDIIDETTGQLTGVWGTTSSTTITMGGPAAYAGGVGGRVVWETGQIRRGRRVRGSTFLVPFSNNAYDSDGTLTETCVNTIVGGIDAFMVQAPEHALVWSRPKAGSGGVSLPVLTGRAPDKVSWLRTRRT